MGKSLHCTTRLHEFCRIVSSDKPRRAERVKPIYRNRVFIKEAGRMSGVRVESGRVKQEGMEGRVPLAVVVSDCVKRWFEETLKEARAGDITMQVLVGQMYNSGYGVTRDTQKGRAWIDRASKGRSSVWKLGDKHPGYNASESDPDGSRVDGK